MRFFLICSLQAKGLLVRNFTQNIDGLEFIAGVSADQVVQAHGGFQSAHCIECGDGTAFSCFFVFSLQFEFDGEL